MNTKIICIATLLLGSLVVTTSTAQTEENPNPKPTTTFPTGPYVPSPTIPKPPKDTAHQQKSFTGSDQGNLQLPPLGINSIQTGIISDFDAFVFTVRPYYRSGDTYTQFRKKVLQGNQTAAAKTALPTLPSNVELLLKKAYAIIVKQANVTPKL